MSFFGNIYGKLVTDDIKGQEHAVDVDQWKRFLASLPEPRDCIDESFNKYCCRMQYFPKWKRLLLNLLAAVFLATRLPVLFDQAEPLPKMRKSVLLVERRRALGYEDVIPDELRKAYWVCEEVKQGGMAGTSMCMEARLLFRSLCRRRPINFYFQLLVFKELTIHSDWLRSFNPEATAVYANERNVASPMLTQLYEESGRHYVSFMHGEYLLHLVQAYMRFSTYYVWSEHYVHMFSEELKCDRSQFVVYMPGKLKKKWHLEEVQPGFDYTYYFSAESRRSIECLAQLFSALEVRGLRCKVRPHPRYSHTEFIKDIFSHVIVEDPDVTTLEESLGDTRYAVGLATTVLTEAYVEGRGVVIDDLSSPELFEDARRRHAACLERGHLLLSECAKACGVIKNNM